MKNEVNATASECFAVKIINGATPEVWRRGEIDGLAYLPIELDGVKYWPTDVGLFDPPEEPASRLSGGQ